MITELLLAAPWQPDMTKDIQTKPPLSQLMTARSSRQLYLKAQRPAAGWCVKAAQLRGDRGMWDRRQRGLWPGLRNQRGFSPLEYNKTARAPAENRERCLNNCRWISTLFSSSSPDHQPPANFDVWLQNFAASIWFDWPGVKLQMRICLPRPQTARGCCWFRVIFITLHTQH